MRLKFILTIVLLLTTVPAWATTYYVATSGLDSNPGTSGSPFLTIQKCIDVVVAGDTCTVADGTYTVSGSTRYIGRVTATHASGTSGSPITLKSTNPLGADLVLPVHVNGNFGIEINRSYWIIEGFDIAGGGVNAGAGSTGIAIQSGTGNLIRKTTIHGIAAGICTNTTDGNTGVYISGSATSTTVESSVIHTIGRLRNGESGCSTTISYNDHGVYVEGGTGTTIQRNIFYNDTRGWPVHVYKGGASTTTNLNILNNTFANQSSPAAGHILLQTNTVTTANIKNNISSDVYLGMLQCNNVTTATNVSVSFNLTDHASSIKTLACTANIVFASNTLNTSPGFVNAGARDYTLASGSAAIDTGTAISGFANNGAALDKGTYETITFASCVVEDGDASKVRVTHNNNANPPLKPTASPGTFTSRKAGANNPITASTVTGSNRVDLTLTNAIVNGNAVDISWASGNLTDSALIGGTLNQGYKTVLTNQSCTNNVGAASTYEYTQTRFAWHGLRGTESAPVSAPYATAPENTNIFVSVGGKGSARLRIKLTNTVADPPPTGFLLRYSRNAGAYTIVPDTFGADKIAYCGSGPDPDVPQSGTPTTERLTAGGTFTAGALRTTSNAVNTVNMALNGTTEFEDCISWATDSAPGDTFDFRLYQQDGTALNTYTVTPRATLRAMGAGSGF